MEGKIKVLKADIQQLPFEDNSFDAVIIEAVTMFVNREKAVAEVMRVCKVGGKILEHEFIWRKNQHRKQEKYLKEKYVRALNSIPPKIG